MEKSGVTSEFVSDWLAIAPAYSVLVELNAEDHDCVAIEKLETWPIEKRNRGEATRALESLCKLADYHRVSLCGNLQPYGANAEKLIRLRLWLGRYGFNLASRTCKDVELLRYPKQPYTAVEA